MTQLSFFEQEDKKLLNLREASIWASQYLNREVSVSNISYLIQYGRIKKYGNNGNIFVRLQELKDYYASLNHKEKRFKERFGDNLNWHLSFEQYT